ncbi:MAG: dTMP kinase [Ruminococcaceae bacterium]|nr:dTMP kinase [Oscillospiraceae bacterium]
MQERKRGRFIVLEGIDGCGKSTQIERLAERLRAEGREVAVTAEPTDSASGKMLRAALSGADRRGPCEMAALFLLDRIYHNVSENGIEAMLAKGIDVICDRYYYSSLAYQGSETDFAWVRDMNLACPEIRRPDLCLFLDVEPRVSLARIAASRTSTEIYEKEELLEKFRARFLEVFAMLKETDRVAVVDASRDVDEVAEAVYRAVKENAEI